MGGSWRRQFLNPRAMGLVAGQRLLLPPAGLPATAAVERPGLGGSRDAAYPEWNKRRLIKTECHRAQPLGIRKVRRKAFSARIATVGIFLGSGAQSLSWEPIVGAGV